MESGLELEMVLSEESDTEFGVDICKKKMDFHCKIREIVGKLRCEMEKRDKILDILVNGGDVTLVNLDVNVDSQTQEENNKAAKEATRTKTFELLIKTKVPYKIETVTLTPIDWDELTNLLENGSGGISLLSQDIKPESEPGKEKESQPNSTDVHVDEKIPPVPAKRLLSETETEPELVETTTTSCENQNENQNQPVEKRAKFEKNSKDCDVINELPEYFIDKSFFESKNPSATPSKNQSKSTSNQKFLIRFHDHNTEQICLYDIFHFKSISISSQKFQLSLQEITAAISVHNSSNPGSKLEIWCDLKDFDIFSNLNSSSNSVRYFLQSFGEFISHFTFSLGSSDIDKQKYDSIQVDSHLLFRFILQNFPNLEFLSINSETLNNLEDLNLNLNLNLNLPVKLVRLKTLKFLQSKTNESRISSAFLAKLLKQTPRLESIHGIPLQCVKEIAKLDKILMADAAIEDPLSWIGSSIPKLAIRSCFIQTEIYFQQPHKFLEDLLDLCNLDTATRNRTGNGRGRIFVALEEFNAQRFFIRDQVLLNKSVNLLFRLLHMNRESLAKLTLEPNSKAALMIPRLDNLKILRFNFDFAFDIGKETFPAFFPAGFRPSYTFPKLEQVEMVLTPQNFQSQSRIPPNFLRQGETFETVQSLGLRGILLPAETGLWKIRSMFPNLTKLQLNNSLYEIARFLQPVFQHFPHLHQLVLEIDTGSRHGNLDAALTGINVDLCRHLEKFVPCPIEGNGREKLLQIIQSGRSLSDLKELRLLKFVLRSGVTRELDKIPIFTPVSFEYGLGPEQLKNVKIFLDFHEKTSGEVKTDILTALAPVLPFMTVL